MLPQHLVCKYELNCEYCTITLARNKAPWWWSDKIETCPSVLKCFMWNYMCIRWLINWSDCYVTVWTPNNLRYSRKFWSRIQLTERRWLDAGLHSFLSLALDGGVSFKLRPLTCGGRHAFHPFNTFHGTHCRCEHRKFLGHPGNSLWAWNRNRTLHRMKQQDKRVRKTSKDGKYSWPTSR